MPRPIWKGQISFGLVSIPVTLVSAEAPDDGVKFHFVDKSNHARVRNQRINEKTGKPVEWENIVRGYELDDGSYVLFTDEELDELEVEANQAVEIEAFVEASEIHRSFYSKPYHLVPDKKNQKGYVILLEALSKNDKIGIARVVIRTKQYLSALAPEDDHLMLYLLRYPSELRELEAKDLPGTTKESKISEAERKIADQLVAAMTQEWNPDQFKDNYKEALLEWVEKKSESGGTKAPDDEKGESDNKVVNIMSLLKESIDRAKKGDEDAKSKPAAAPKSRKKA